MALFDGCQGRWKLANGVWTDGSANGNTLTPSSPAPAATTGFDGTASAAALFTRASGNYLYKSDATQTGLDIVGALSIAARIKLTSVGAGEYHMIVAKMGAPGQYGYDLFVDPDKKLNFRGYYDGSNPGWIVVGTTVLTVGVWYLVIAVYNQTDARIFLNNVLDCTPGAFTGAIFNNNANFAIGKASDLVNHGMNGVIDDVAVWNKGLSGAERTEFESLTDDFGATVSISGVLKNKSGSAVDCSVNNSHIIAMKATGGTYAVKRQAAVTAADGTWSLGGLEPLTDYHLAYGQVDTGLAGSEFVTTPGS